MICALVLGVQTCALPIFIVAARKELGDAYVAQPSDAVMERMVGLGRLGRKSAKGWYDYPEGGKKHLWPGLAEMFPPAAVQPGVEAVKERLLYRQLIECARCFAEGVLATPEDGDIGDRKRTRLNSSY